MYERYPMFVYLSCRLELSVPSIRFQKQQAILATTPNFYLLMDTNPILTLEVQSTIDVR
jgi:hypothetical protein